MEEDKSSQAVEIELVDKDVKFTLTLAQAMIATTIQAKIELQQQVSESDLSPNIKFGTTQPEFAAAFLVEYMQHHNGVEPALIERPLRVPDMKEVTKNAFDVQFMARVMGVSAGGPNSAVRLYQVIAAAERWGIKSLVHLGLAQWAALIQLGRLGATEHIKGGWLKQIPPADHWHQKTDALLLEFLRTLPFSDKQAAWRHLCTCMSAKDKHLPLLGAWQRDAIWRARALRVLGEHGVIIAHEPGLGKTRMIWGLLTMLLLEDGLQQHKSAEPVAAESKLKKLSGAPLAAQETEGRYGPKYEILVPAAALETWRREMEHFPAILKNSTFVWSQEVELPGKHNNQVWEKQPVLLAGIERMQRLNNQSDSLALELLQGSQQHDAKKLSKRKKQQRSGALNERQRRNKWLLSSPHIDSLFTDEVHRERHLLIPRGKGKNCKLQLDFGQKTAIMLHSIRQRVKFAYGCSGTILYDDVQDLAVAAAFVQGNVGKTLDTWSSWLQDLYGEEGYGPGNSNSEIQDTHAAREALQKMRDWQDQYILTCKAHQVESQVKAQFGLSRLPRLDHQVVRLKLSEAQRKLDEGMFEALDVAMEEHDALGHGERERKEMLSSAVLGLITHLRRNSVTPAVLPGGLWRDGKHGHKKKKKKPSRASQRNKKAKDMMDVDDEEEPEDDAYNVDVAQVSKVVSALQRQEFKSSESKWTEAELRKQAMALIQHYQPDLVKQPEQQEIKKGAKKSESKQEKKKKLKTVQDESEGDNSSLECTLNWLVRHRIPQILATSVKIQFILDDVHKFLATAPANQGIAVFCQWCEPLELLSDILYWVLGPECMRERPRMYTGQMKPKAKIQALADFQSILKADPEVRQGRGCFRTILCSAGSASECITMTAGTRLISGNPQFTAMYFEQLKHRVLRVNQLRDVTVVSLLIDDAVGVEQWVANGGQAKCARGAHVLGHGSYVGSMSDDYVKMTSQRKSKGGHNFKAIRELRADRRKLQQQQQQQQPSPPASSSSVVKSKQVKRGPYNKKQQEQPAEPRVERLESKESKQSKLATSVKPGKADKSISKGRQKKKPELDEEERRAYQVVVDLTAESDGDATDTVDSDDSDFEPDDDVKMEDAPPIASAPAKSVSDAEIDADGDSEMKPVETEQLKPPAEPEPVAVVVLQASAAVAASAPQVEKKKKRKKRSRVTMLVRRRNPVDKSVKNALWQVEEQFEDTLNRSIQLASKIAQQKQAEQWNKLPESARLHHQKLLQLQFGNVWDDDGAAVVVGKRKEHPDERDGVPAPSAKRAKHSE